jgi:hypothetical protein
MTLEVHIAGTQVKVGCRVRQRCAWCGAVLDDVDLHAVAVPVDQPAGGFPEWRPGSLVAIDDGVRWIVNHKDGDDVPDGCCVSIDPEVTG